MQKFVQNKKIDSGKNIVKPGSNIMSTNVILHGIDICTNEFKTR